MGFFLGFFLGIGAGVGFGEYGLNFPVGYKSKENGFGKLELNLEVLDPVYHQFTSISNYFSSAKSKVFKRNDENKVVENVIKE